MSFGFGIGDILAVSNLADELYRHCYVVARGAPQEFQLLLQEIGTLSKSIMILKQEISNPDLVPLLSGENKLRVVSEMIAQVKGTLSDIRTIAEKFQRIRDMPLSRRKMIWIKFKWSAEASELGSLRNKVSSGL